MKKGFLLLISGPSGVGKGTLCNLLLEKNKDMIFSISATTRRPREGEVDGVNYNFISEEHFKKMIENDEFLEYAHVHTNYYGTPKKTVYEGIESGKIVLLEIDVQGALQVKKNHPELVSIFILPPSMKELKKRLEDRGTETQEELNKRIENAYKEIDILNEYEYFIINDNLENALEDLEAIIFSERQKIVRQEKLKERYLREEL